MNISPKLQLNLHPKDAENLSLVTALNVKLANDESCITNEESIVENTFIRNKLNEYYGSNNYTIVAIIPCNVELVIISVNNDDSTKAQIFRYREATSTVEESMKCVYGNNSTNYLKYHGGKIKGTFTYNVENSLIIAIAEYDGMEKKIPLRTINLGNYDDETIFNDKEVPDSVLSISPEVYIPAMRNLSYVKGNAYKGWYYLFVRFKINSVDYTQWFSFGFPIFIDTLEHYAVTKYAFRQKITGMNNQGAFAIVTPQEPEDGFCAGCSDYFSNTSDIANETFKIDIIFNSKNNVYNKYQIGIICASKSYTKAFRTSDINTDFGSYGSYTKEFILNNASLIEASAEEFIIDNYNYFDVKNIINYQNKLYISNYKENNANDKIIENLVNNISLSLVKSSITGSGISRDYTIMSDNDIGRYNNQYEGDDGGIPATSFFNVHDTTNIYISGTCTIYTKDGNTTQNISKVAQARNIYIIEKSSDITPVDGTLGYSRKYNIPDFISFIIVDSNYETWKTTVYKFTGVVTLRLEYNNNSNYSTLEIDCDKYAINSGVNYLNPNNSFDTRKKQHTLIEGEVYNFFIHYVDKYGHCTNGYRINNNIKYYGETSPNSEIVPIPFTYNGKTYYGAAPIDNNVAIYGSVYDTIDYDLNTSGIRIYSNISGTTLTGDVTSSILTAFSQLFRSFASSDYLNVKWYQITSGFGFNNFLPYINNNGDRLFKVPINSHRSTSINRYLYNISGVTIPEGYVGWFLSYEKFEPIKRVTGILTRNDFRSQDCVINKDGSFFKLYTANCQKSDLMYFYSGQYDISDSIRLDYNLLRIDAINCFDPLDIPNWDYNQRGDAYKFCHDMNKPQVDSYKLRQTDKFETTVNVREFETAPAIYAPSEYKLAIADSAADGRIGLGTALQMKDSYNLFPSYIPTADNKYKIKIYKATLFNASRDIYMSNNKTLIRCTNIQYSTSLSNNDKDANGVMTYDGCLIYENPGFTFNTSNNIAYRTKINNKYYTSEADRKHTWELNVPFLAYCQFPVIDDHFYESKCFKNEPTGYVFYVRQDTSNLDKANENNKFQTGCIVTSANSIDLFENRQGSSDAFNSKSFTNYREDLVSVDNYNKTVRRSAVIQDETRVNGWRTFPVEAYKNISENKGIITNLIGIGTILLVHTEHSLFMFNTDNTLETKDKAIQLSQPDTFDVKYQEVFTSSLGYGGLQDDKSFVVDQFGYTFYNNDFHRFYNFDNGQLNTMDDDIIQWLDKYKPYNVRFANDKFNNRILIKMNYKIDNVEKDIVLSYNYNANHFVSLHSYYFDEAYNTKSKLYLKCNEDSHTDCSLHQFVQDGSSYGNADNVKNKIRSTTLLPAKIGIIINEQYDNVKFLEHITYKLNKLVNPTKIDYTYSPVEGMVTPYSADLLKVYNNEVDTGELDILINKEEAKNVFCNYKKPYWELGNWNYNYLRNNIANYDNYGDAFTMSRLYGNYFVVEFTFSNSDNLKIEFEELKYNITK